MNSNAARGIKDFCETNVQDEYRNSFSHNHGSEKWLYLKGNYYWKGPCFTSMIMGGRVITSYLPATKRIDYAIVTFFGDISLHLKAPFWALMQSVRPYLAEQEVYGSQCSSQRLPWRISQATETEVTTHFWIDVSQLGLGSYFQERMNISHLLKVFFSHPKMDTQQVQLKPPHSKGNTVYMFQGIDFLVSIIYSLNFGGVLNLLHIFSFFLAIKRSKSKK